MSQPALSGSVASDVCVAPPEVLSPDAGAAQFKKTSAVQRAVVLGLVIIPLLGLATAIWLAWGTGLSILDLVLFFVMYQITGLGITIGFHRLFTHRSFETVRPIELLLGVMGSMATQGPLLVWTANHRRHHQHSDEAEDPHSPHGHGEGVGAVLRGFWHAHIGWMMSLNPRALGRYVLDLQQDAGLRRISDWFVFWVALGLVLPGVIGGLVTQSWYGALTGFLWGGLVRMGFTHHVTWSINSVCHLWGARDYASRDESRNNAIFGLLAMGEGWHNNHHAFPTSARHGLRWWQFDGSYALIRGLELCGLAWRVRLPSRNALDSLRIRK